MTDDRHQEGTPGGGSRWDPLPQGDYDDGATAFVNLPEGGIDALLDSPLAAPGHGYVPPQITVTPAATGTDPGAAWPAAATPADGAQWHDPNAGQDMTGDDRFTYQSGASGPWEYEDGGSAEATSAGMQQQSAPGHDVTGQWSIPVAGGDLPDESGEFTTSSLVEQWGGTPPPTLPGGAAAPWATPQSIGEPWGPATAEEPADYAQGQQQLQDHGRATEHGHHPAPGQPYGEPDPAGQHRPHHSPDGAQDQPYAGQGRPYAQEQAGYDGQPAPGYEHAHVPVQQDAADLAAQQHLVDQQPLADPHAAEQAPQHPADAYEAAPAAGRTEPQPAEYAPVAAAVPGDAQSGPDEAPESPADAAAEPAEPDEADSAPDPAGDAAEPETAGEPAPQDGAETDAEAAGAAATQPATALNEDHPLSSYVLRVNGTDRPVADAWIGESLLYVLRERLGLAGAKDGCSQGECGACNVQVDGRLVASCLVPGVTAAGSEVRTVEGLASDGRPSDVQRALARCGAVQCGFCVPGMAMTVHDLLEGNPAPTELETRQALCGNLCRCSGYRGVVDAVKEVVAEREAHRAADASETDADGVRIPHQAGAGGVNSTAFGGPQPPGRGGPHDQSHGQDGGPA